MPSVRRVRRSKKLNRTRAIGHMDYTLLFVVILLLAFGVVMVYSVSSYSAFVWFNDSFYYAKRQLIFAVLGIVAMIGVSRLPEKFFNSKIAPMAFWIMSLLQVVVLFLGKTAGGSSRWLDLGIISFQPSEITKVAVIIYIPYLIIRAVKKINKVWYMSTEIFLISAVPIGLIALENLSTAIITAGISLAIIFSVTLKMKRMLPILGIGTLGVAGFVALAGYRSDRFEAWLNVETHEKAHQTRQALYAIGSGGFFGKGLGQSIQKLGYVPEAHTDMIFSVICEELGLFGGMCVIALYVLFMWRCMIIANNAPSLFSHLMVVGVMVHVGLQAIVNIAVNVNAIPNTGVTLPFISYGGTSLLVLLAEIGLVLGVSRRIRIAAEEEA